MNKKTIRVVAAVIKSFDINKNKTLIFSTQKGKGEFENGWEFPGGKIEPNETNEAALVREIKEELDILVEVKNFFTHIEYDYTSFHLSMDCYICKIKAGIISLIEHESAKWLSKDELDSVPWIPADLKIIEKLKIYLANLNK